MSDSQVEISIVVVDQNGTEAVKKLSTELGAVGEAGALAGAKGGEGLDKISGHALTSLDNVRLLRDDLGIRIPRSMEKAIASSGLLSGAIGAIGGALLAVGALEIFVHMADGIHAAYEKYVDLNAASKEFNEQRAKAQNEDFINPRSIETAIMRIHDATEAAKIFDAEARSMRANFWSDLAHGNFSGASDDVLIARQMEQRSQKDQADADQSQAAKIEMAHKLNQAQIELTAETHKTGQAAHDHLVALQLELATSQELQRYTVEQGSLHGNAQAPDAAQHQRDLADLKAFAEYHNQQREEAEHAAKEAQDAQKHALEAQAELDARASKATADAAAAGLTGIARIQAQAHAALAEIDAQEKKAASTTKGGETDAQRAAFEKERAAAATTADQKIAESQQSYFEEMDRMQEQYVTSSSEGYARIGEEAQKASQRAEDGFKKEAGGADVWNAVIIADWVKLQGTLSIIQQGAEIERQRLHAETMDALQKR